MGRVSNFGNNFLRGSLALGNENNGKIGRASDQQVREMAVALKTDESGIRRMVDSLAAGQTGKGLSQRAAIRYSPEARTLIDGFPDGDESPQRGRFGTRINTGRGGNSSNVGWQQAIDRAIVTGNLKEAHQLAQQARQQGIRVITPEQRARLADAEVKLQKRITAAVTEKTADLEELQKQIYQATGEIREIERTVQVDNEYRQIKLNADGKVEVKRFDDPLKGKASIVGEELKAQQAQAALSGQQPHALSKIVESGGRYLRVTVDAEGQVKTQNVKKVEAKIEQAVERLARKQLEHFQRTGEMKSFKEKIKVGKKRFEVTLTADGQVKVKQKKTFFQKLTGFVGKFLLPVLTVASLFVPGLQVLALPLKILGAVKGGIESIVHKSWLGLAGSALGAFSGNLASALQRGFSAVQTGYNVVKNGIKNFWDGIGAVTGAVSNIAGGAVSKIAGYLSQGVGVIGSFVRGDIGGGLLGLGSLVGGEVKNNRLEDSWKRFNNGEQLSSARLNELQSVRGLSDEQIAGYRNRIQQVTQQTENLSLAQITQFAKDLGLNSTSQLTANGTSVPGSNSNSVVELMRQNAARRGLTPEQTEIYLAQGLKLAQETRDKSSTQLALEAAGRRNLTPEQTLEYLKQGERLSQDIAAKSPARLAFEAAQRRGMNAEQTLAYIKQGEEFALETRNLLTNPALANPATPSFNSSVKPLPGQATLDTALNEIQAAGGAGLAPEKVLSIIQREKGIEVAELIDTGIDLTNLSPEQQNQKVAEILEKKGIISKLGGKTGYPVSIVISKVQGTNAEYYLIPYGLAPAIKQSVVTIEDKLKTAELVLRSGKPAALFSQDQLSQYFAKVNQGLPEGQKIPQQYINEVITRNNSLAAESATRQVFNSRKEVNPRPQSESLNDLRNYAKGLASLDTQFNDTLSVASNVLSGRQSSAFDDSRKNLKAGTAKVDTITQTLEKLQIASKSGALPSADNLKDFNNALAEAKGLGLISETLYTQLDGQRKQLQQQFQSRTTPANPRQNESPAGNGWQSNSDLRELANMSRLKQISPETLDNLYQSGKIPGDLYSQLSGKPIQAGNSQNPTDYSKYRISVWDLATNTPSNSGEILEQAVTKPFTDTSKILAALAGATTAQSQSFARDNANSPNPVLRALAKSIIVGSNVTDTTRYGFNGTIEEYEKLKLNNPEFGLPLKVGEALTQIGQGAASPVLLFSPSATDQERLGYAQNVVLDFAAGKVLKPIGEILNDTRLGTLFTKTDINPLNRPVSIADAAARIIDTTPINPDLLKLRTPPPIESVDSAAYITLKPFRDQNIELTGAFGKFVVGGTLPKGITIRVEGGFGGVSGQKPINATGWTYPNILVETEKDVMSLWYFASRFSKESPILGRTPQVDEIMLQNPGKYQKLWANDWTPGVNDVYVQGAIDRSVASNQPIRFASDPTNPATLLAKGPNGEVVASVTALEIEMVRRNGFTFQQNSVGEWFAVPPRSSGK